MFCFSLCACVRHYFPFLRAFLFSTIFQKHRHRDYICSYITTRVYVTICTLHAGQFLCFSHQFSLLTFSVVLLLSFPFSHKVANVPATSQVWKCSCVIWNTSWNFVVQCRSVVHEWRNGRFLLKISGASVFFTVCEVRKLTSYLWERFQIRVFSFDFDGILVSIHHTNSEYFLIFSYKVRLFSLGSLFFVFLHEYDLLTIF